MTSRAQQLARKIEAFNRDMLACVRECTDADWVKNCEAEDWTVGVVARHVGEGHYRVGDLARMIINGEALPEWTMEEIVQMGNDHARKHADCSKEEVLSILEENGRALAEYVAALSEDDLDARGNLALLGGDISTQQILEMLILHSGGDHLKSMRTTLAG
ncbi:MAG: maleylpyruvate isomerase N-terminal domain-containing protein [Desulfobacterales bacterium]|nr:maleylpyruvate isomerase N-terminal domain-containing protein [Desulfobacterales bacterium]